MDTVTLIRSAVRGLLAAVDTELAAALRGSRHTSDGGDAPAKAFTSAESSSASSTDGTPRCRGVHLCTLTATSRRTQNYTRAGDDLVRADLSAGTALACRNYDDGRPRRRPDPRAPDGGDRLMEVFIDFA
jgi:hypothetical protein